MRLTISVGFWQKIKMSQQISLNSSLCFTFKFRRDFLSLSTSGIQATTFSRSWWGGNKKMMPPTSFTLSRVHFRHFHTFTLTLSPLSHFHRFHTFTAFTLSPLFPLSHFHLYTFTLSLLSHFCHFHTFTCTISQLSAEDFRHRVEINKFRDQPRAQFLPSPLLEQVNLFSARCKIVFDSKTWFGSNFCRHFQLRCQLRK